MPHDAAAAREAAAAIRAARMTVESVLASRRRAADVARVQWRGRHRHGFDAAEAAVERSAQAVLHDLLQAERAVLAELDQVREVNRHRAVARRLREEGTP